MEEQLDEVEEGKLKWTTALRDFYEKFSRDLEAFKKYSKEKKVQSIPTDEICENCGSPMVIKFGRYGQFLACSRYPECRTTRELAKPAGNNGRDGDKAVASDETNAAGNGEAVEVEQETCELCGKPMALKRGRFGQFLGCTGYPECRNIRKISKSGTVAPPPVPLDEKCPVDGAQLVKRFGRFGEFISCSNYPKCKYIKQETTGAKCTRPGCGGEIVVKKSRRGKVFYGCANYPKCETVFWDKPVEEKCPQCDVPFLLEKTTKKQGTFRYCATEGCGYRSNEPAAIAKEARPQGKHPAAH